MEIRSIGKPDLTQEPQTDYLGVVYDRERTPKTDYPSRLADYLIRRFALKAGSRFLEIGCGRGDFLLAFSEAGMQCHGVDREKSSQAFVESLEVRQCDVSRECLPFEDESFDVVYHKSLIEHLYDPMPLMDETRRVLKKGGKLIVLTPDWNSQMQNFYEDYTHCRPFTPQALKDLLNIQGFHRVTAERFYQLPCLWKYPSLAILSSVLRSFLSVYSARWLTQRTGVRYFRWSVELMVLAYGEK